MVDNISIEERVKVVIAEQLNKDVKDIVNTADFSNDLGADSLDTVEMIMALEDEFDAEIPDEEAAKMKVVQDAIDYVNNYVAKHSKN